MYISVHAKRVWERGEMRGLPSKHFTFFRNEFNKFNNNTIARMLDLIYHMKLRLLWNLISGVKTS